MSNKKMLVFASMLLTPAFLAGCSQPEASTYQAVFYDWDSTILAKADVKKGEAAIYSGATPTRAHDSLYTYTFSSWDKALDNVQQNVDFHAVYAKSAYTPEVVKYNVDFHNYDGSLLASQSVEAGKLASYGAATPTRVMDEVYTYTFKGWDKDLSKYAINENTIFTAQYTANARELVYAVNFVNWDGSLIKSENVKKGGYATAPANPSHASDASATYAFKDWDKDPSKTPIVANTSFVAQFDATARSYSVSFVNFDGAILKSESVEAGKKATAPDAVPNRSADASYRYSFRSWSIDPNLFEVYADTTFVAQFDRTALATMNYHVEFLNWDGQLYAEINVKDGEYAAAPNVNPTRPSDGNFTYSFGRWDQSPVNTPIKANTKFMAQYTRSAITKTYPVEFRNYDGTLLLSGNVPAGKTCADAGLAYAALAPSRSSDGNHRYTFSHWDQDPALAITSATSFYAVFDATAYYTVSFLNYDGSVLLAKKFLSGDTPVYASTDPVRESDETGSYVFAGWDKTLAPVTADTYYKATFTKTARKYTVNFRNWDSTLVDSEEVAYGEYASAPGVVPTRLSDIGNVYTFKDWGVVLASTPIKGNVDLFATYTSSVRTYTVNFVDYDGTVLATREVGYGDPAGAYSPTGEVPVRDNEPDGFYQFSNWDSDADNLPVTHDVDYHAVYSRVSYDYAYTYQLVSGAYTITKANTDSYPNIMAWSVLKTHLDLPVTKIGDGAFKMDPAMSAHVSSVEFAEGLLEIGASAFENADIKEVALPESLQSITSTSFLNCLNLESFNVNGTSSYFTTDDNDQLLVSADESTVYCAANASEEIVLPAAVSDLEPSAISHCPSLAKVTFLCEGLNSVKVHADTNFIDCPLLSEFAVGYGADTGTLWVDNGVLYGGNSLLHYPQAKSLDYTMAVSHTIGASTYKISTIGAYACYEANLQKFHADASASNAKDSPLTTIGAYAFARCNASVVGIYGAPDGSEISIGEKAFNQCSKLSGLYISRYGSLGANCASDNPALTEVLIVPATVSGKTVTLGASAFANDPLLSRFSSPIGSLRLGNSCFAGSTAYTYWGEGAISLSSDSLGTSTHVYEGCSAASGVLITPDFASKDLPEATLKGCTGIKWVYYTGADATSMASVKSHIGTDNDVLSTATWLLFADTQPASNPENYWHYVNNVPTIWTAA